MEDARERLEDVASDETVKHDIEKLRFNHKLPERLTSSLIRAYMLNPEAAKDYYEAGQDRDPRSLVPKSFLRAYAAHLSNDYKTSSLPPDELWFEGGALYLKQKFSPETNFAEVFAHYFSTDEEISAAKLRSNSSHYLPYNSNEKYSAEKAGYRGFLPNYQRKLIDTAIALYLITDENGDIDWDRIPEISFGHRYELYRQTDNREYIEDGR
jgi:hypothetical protein